MISSTFLRSALPVVASEHTQTNVIVPDAHGDWLNQRDDSYAKFMRVDGKKTKESSIFLNYSNGIKSGRDSWGLQQFKE